MWEGGSVDILLLLSSFFFLSDFAGVMMMASFSAVYVRYYVVRHMRAALCELRQPFTGLLASRA